jgi:hypothetical protein
MALPSSSPLRGGLVRRGLVLVLSGLWLPLGLAPAGCGSDPAPPPEVPAPEPAPEPEPPPPPKPECKALDEKCKADASTQALLAHTDLAFVPPSGWIYAQEADLTITQTEDGGGALAMTAFEAKDPKSKETKASREGAIETLARAAGVELPMKNKKRVAPNWDKPDGDVKVGDMTLQMWQFEGASRGSSQGPVLFFAARTGDTQLVGLGFAKTGDTSDQDILKALETIGPAPMDGVDGGAEGAGDGESAK